MKKQLILAAITAALMTAPFVDAAAKPSSSSSSSRSSSGFSSSKSSSSYKPSSSSYSAPSRTYAPSPAPSRVDTSRSTATSGLSGFGASSRKADTPKPRASDYSQLNRVAPQPAAPYGSATVSPAEPKTGFATTTSSSTKKKLAGAAGATALGGALYVAGSNHEAVAAYEASQQPAPATTAAPSTNSSGSTTNFDRRTASVPAQQPAPQVIVVREQHYPRNDSYHDVQDAYREGVRDAQRTARITTPSMGSYTPSLQAPRAQVTQQSATAPAVKEESGLGSYIMWTIVTLMVLGAMAFFVMQVLNVGTPKSSNKPAARRSNYTL